MITSVSLIGLTSLTLLATFYLFRRALGTRKDLPLPPGPKGLPIVGNLFDTPRPGEHEYQHWLKFKDPYGPISSIKIPGQVIIILNDAKLAMELLRDRSATYSSRPSLTYGGKMCGYGNTTGLLAYDDTLKEHRRNITKVVTTMKSRTMIDRVQETETAHFLLNVLDKPEELFNAIMTEASSVVLKVVYGYTTSRGKDLLVDLAERAMSDVSKITLPGKYLVDSLPFLQYFPSWLPGMGWKRRAKDIRLHLHQSIDQPYQFVRQQMRAKKAKTSYISQAIEAWGTDPKEAEIHRYSALSIYLAGSETTVSSLQAFFVAMMLYPDVQKKAQEELDRVIGSERLANSTDKNNLPYIEATVMEVHRWKPILPLSIPHHTSHEDVWHGYRIPKDSTIIPNVWWFTHDPSVYADPETFNPDRYITTPTHTAEPDPRAHIFGYGRRICPGRYVADNALFLTIAQALSVFNVEKPVVDGVVIEPEARNSPGLINKPFPYLSSIKPRSKVHEELIRKSEEVYPWEASDEKELESVKW
ncbi:cytochrome P450 [Massarina eburnea CBS 473.64]|uniref:Cytochrome P450 n=1 Tax=Massarina eburnea CBS 473.64 TaxID=1395130 RepID=A0A6A6RHW0_9PLEO|nr:cytochrome P450 [Massarina eburnea CBS 473.64]